VTVILSVAVLISVYAKVFAPAVFVRKLPHAAWPIAVFIFLLIIYQGISSKGIGISSCIVIQGSVSKSIGITSCIVIQGRVSKGIGIISCISIQGRGAKGKSRKPNRTYYTSKLVFKRTIQLNIPLYN